MKHIDIETLAQWSEPKHINTKQGPKILRTAPPKKLLPDSMIDLIY